MSIKKYKNNGKFGFKSDKIKVEFSKPHIQAHDDYAFCKTERGILYYYYTVKVKAKFYKKWERVVDIYTHDFPEIINFKYLLEAFLLDKIDISNYQKDTNSFDTVWKTYTADTGFFCDDYYSITGNLIDKEEGIQENYSVTIGKSLDYSTHEVVGITLNHFLDEEDTDATVESIYNIFQTVKEHGNGFDTEVSCVAHKGDATGIETKGAFWVGDELLNEADVKLTFEEAYNRLMESNYPKPHSRQCVLRKELGPKNANAQYIFGNKNEHLYVDAVTGDVKKNNPVYEGFEEDPKFGYAFTWLTNKKENINSPLGEWP